MDSRNDVDAWPADEAVFELHQVLDVVTTIAYFVFALVLIHFMRSSLLPHKRELIYFGIVAIFCGVYNMTNIWRYYLFPATKVTTISKVCSAAMLWLAIVVLNCIFPDLLTLKRRELSLKNKIEELNSRLSLMQRQENTRKSFNKLVHEIRSTVDAQCIMNAAIVGLADMLKLEECALWFPSQTDSTMCLTQCLNSRIPLGAKVPMSLPELAEIYGSVKPVRVSPTCPLVNETSMCERSMAHDLVAVRVPLLRLPFSDYNVWLRTSARGYAVIVVIPPSNRTTKFRDDELELVGDVGEQVAVALAHSSAAQNLYMACDQLRRQNSSLALQSRTVGVKLVDAKLWRDGTLNHILTLQNITPFLSSFLLETTLTPEQRTMVESVLKSSSSLDIVKENINTLILLDTNRFVMNAQIFVLSATIKQVVDKIKPIAEVKRLSLTLSLAPDLPAYAAGDRERLKLIILNILANAVKYTNEGSILVTASVADRHFLRFCRPRCTSSLKPVKHHFYLLMKIQDSGCGIDRQELPNCFHRYVDRPRPPTSLSSRGFGLPVCERLLMALGGEIWIQSDGLDRGTTVTFVLKLRKRRRGPSPDLTAGESNVNT